MRPIILIPARMASTRLPNKPMKDIGGLPMIVQVLKRAQESGVGDVVVATDHLDIQAAVQDAGGRAVMTREDHPSGSDRIWEALCQIDPEQEYDVVVNLQGDIPTLEPRLIRDVIDPLEDAAVDIATLACQIETQADKTNPNIVKVVLALQAQDSASLFDRFVAHNEFIFDAVQPLGLAPRVPTGRALYFSRATVPTGEGPLYHHIGIYAYRRASLQRFVMLPPSPLELREKLEQLRALEAGMRVDVALVNTAPLGVDTPEQLEEARRVMAP